MTPDDTYPTERQRRINVALLVVFAVATLPVTAWVWINFWPFLILPAIYFYAIVSEGSGPGSKRC